MKRRTIGIIALVVVVLVATAAGGVWLLSRHYYESSYGSEYDYTVRISADGPLENVTVYVPLPVRDGESRIGDVVVNRDYLIPANWSYDVVETQYGPMLRVRADEIPADPTYYRPVIENDRLLRWEEISAAEYARRDDALRVEHDAVELDASLTVNRTIDTRTPPGNESLLNPRANATRTPCDWPGADEEVCYAYDSRVFLQYDASPSTHVSVSVELWATNSWWVGGWNYNEYRDTIHAYDVPATRQGWVVVEGELVTGSGNYPRNPPR